MSNTKRNIPGWLTYGDTVDVERGHVKIPKSDPAGPGNEVWGQDGKKYRKRILTRRLRRTANHTIKDGLK